MSGLFPCWLPAVPHAGSLTSIRPNHQSLHMDQLVPKTESSPTGLLIPTQPPSHRLDAKDLSIAKVYHLGAILSHLGQKSENYPKKDPKTTPDFNRFWGPFRRLFRQFFWDRVFERFLEDFWATFGSLLGSKSAQGSPRRPPTSHQKFQSSEKVPFWGYRGVPRGS